LFCHVKLYAEHSHLCFQARNAIAAVADDNAIGDDDALASLLQARDLRALALELHEVLQHCPVVREAWLGGRPLGDAVAQAGTPCSGA
jgi:hypothetical protein